ncbi:MAG: hypothetical protein QMD09_14850, partial [Desulfatibacillaceae bacterium]|nr:hypothetical protein [Desulfatibacillaceae bacterium]
MTENEARELLKRFVFDQDGVAYLRSMNSEKNRAYAVVERAFSAKYGHEDLALFLEKAQKDYFLFEAALARCCLYLETGQPLPKPLAHWLANFLRTGQRPPKKQTGKKANKAQTGQKANKAQTGQKANKAQTVCENTARDMAFLQAYRILKAAKYKPMTQNPS